MVIKKVKARYWDMEYTEFIKKVYELTSIDLSKYKEKQMKRRIDSLITNNGYKGYDDFTLGIKQDKVMYETFVNYLTINVSEFFRNGDQWEILDKEIYPYISKELSNKPTIWSAACSTGQEPYSLVMSMAKHFPLKDIHIIATDIDKQVLAKAKSGIYNSKEIKGINPEYIKKYFIENPDGTFTVKDEVKKCIEFKQHNLLQDKYISNCDMIVCRNVLIYFTEEAKKEIFIKFRESLKDKGVLFIGSTEQIIRAKEIGYEVWKTFFYRKA